MDTDALTKIFSLTSAAFLVTVLATPLVSNFLYRFRLTKNIRNDGSTPIFSELHAGKQGTPTMGGILVWGTVLVLAGTFWFLDRILGQHSFHILNFLTRRDTLLPLGAMAGAAFVGMADDFLDIQQSGHKGRGFRFRFKVIIYALVALVGAFWFYSKLGFDSVSVPFFGMYHLGIWFIPFFVLIVVGTSFSVNQTDGLDGLAGGVLSMSFLAYAIIAFMQGNTNLAALLGVATGSLLAFLWFNVYPARFFMGDTGSMGLGMLLAIVAFLTGEVFLLPIIGIIFVLEALSFFLQMFWRSAFNKKLFLSSPLHHHFEAAGWPETKVTMRFWILAAISSMLGVIIYLIAH
jgi:phospho-N-acetylmuramoyl-pentapeptide-transferase